MRKKQKNPYKPAKQLGPPYLTPEQISQFQSEFTLFGKQLNLKKLYDSVNSHSEFKNDKLVVPFIAEIKDRQTMSFDAYIQEMIDYFHNQNMNEFILDVLADSSTGEISKETLNQLLEDALGREIQPIEMNSIIEELKKDDKSLLNTKKNVSSQPESSMNT